VVNPAECQLSAFWLGCSATAANDCSPPYLLDDDIDANGPLRSLIAPAANDRILQILWRNTVLPTQMSGH